MKTTLTLDEIVLQKGSHKGPDDGFCVMEAAAYFAGEKFSDFPACVSPVLGAFLRRWNDSVDDEFRQKLKPYVTRIIGTVGDGKDGDRAWMATDWLVRICAPVWLDLAELTEHAMALRTAERITDVASAKRVQPLIDASRKDAAAARNAAWKAANDAARKAAIDAAIDAAWDAPRDAARNAVWKAARKAAIDAAIDAAWDAARKAAIDAAIDVARDVIQHTVVALQASALELLDRMIE